MTQINWKTWPRLVAYLNRAVDLETTACAAGLLQRRRQVRSASDLLRLALAYGPGGQSLRETACWAELQGLATLSATALLYQLRDASDWLEDVALQLLEHGLATEKAMPTSVRPVRLIDGSIISLPGGKDGWRLHATYDLVAERFCGFQLTGKDKAEGLERGALEARALHIGDRVYARPGGLRHLVESDGDFLVRLGVRSLRLLDAQGKYVDLATVVDHAKAGKPVDMHVIVDRHSKRVGSIAKRQADWVPVPARLVILPKPAEAAAQSRKKAARSSQQGMHQLQPGTLKVADHLILLTSLGTDDATPDQLMQLYRKRWQIEIAFKRLKSLIRIDRLPAKEPRLAKAWLCAHLILAILIDAITPHLRDSPPSA